LVTVDSSFSIRPFTADDLPKLSRLIADAIEGCYINVYPPKAVQFFLDYHAPENILRDAAAGSTIIGWLDGTPVATGTLVGSYISRVFVSPRHQRRGYGQAIADELEKLARRRKVEILELDASLTSRGFWEGLGWQVTAHEIELVEDQPLKYYKMTKRFITAPAPQ
jgi:GNAT superfamily N-acetyltransferase